jgi:hypothetical protein
MKRYLIERDIPNVGSLSREQLKGLAATSNDALVKLSGKVQDLLRLPRRERGPGSGALAAGFPITRVNEVPTVIGPMTASD